MTTRKHLPKDDIDLYNDTDSSSSSEGLTQHHDHQMAYGDILDNEVLPLQDTSSEESSEDYDEFDPTWGKRKQTYYGIDYIDEEYIDEDDEALEEEKAAKELQKRELEAIDEDDFDNFGSIMNSDKKKKFTSRKDVEESDLLKSLQEDLTYLKESGVSEKIQKNLAKLSKKELLEVLINDSPEILHLMESFKDNIQELQSWIIPMYTGAKNKSIGVLADGENYLRIKFHLTVNYCVNIAYYLLRKSEGKPTKNHPVISRLVKFRELIDKLSSADAIFDQQVDSLSNAEQNEDLSGSDSDSSEDEYDENIGGSALDDLALFLEDEGPNNKKRKVTWADESPRPKKKQRVYSESDDDDYYYQEAMQKLAQKKDHKKDIKEKHEEALKKGIEYQLDDGTVVGKRAAKEMLKKRPGMRKKKLMRNPRTRNREKYRKAVISRAGQVQKIRKPDNKGEATGINERVVRSTPL